MSDELADFYVHTATVETLEGTDGYGRDRFAGNITLSPTDDYGCFIEQRNRLVRDKDGAEVVSESTLYTSAALAALFTPGSRVTSNGVETRVITASVFTSGDLELPDHVEVSMRRSPRG